ncbi:Arm DNA-binding domain-containing protein [Tardibacter chloracetimidivorans]|uniref:Arm DNA-binding domain-containing protein n=1 Tax=Tardibacter chloracetimidivorans TaxID=1921510 RepID=UPI001D04368C
MGRGRPGTGVEPLKSCIRVGFTYQGKRCRETLALQPTPANIKATERLMAKVQREIELGVFDYARTFPSSGSAVTNGFSTYADGWLAGLTVEKSTRSDYEGALRNVWKPAFGERDITSIKHSEIKKAVADLAERVTAKSVNNQLIPLRQIFATAVDDEIMERSPVLNIKNLKVQKPVPDPFEREEMEAIVAFIADRYDEHILNWYEFAFGTGLRPSEQIAVRWGDVDWRRKTIRVERARVRAVLKGTKTSSIRDVDLTDRMIAVLKRQKAHSFMKGMDAPIFLNPVTGNAWPDVQDQRKLYFHPALRALGIRSRDAYQTRHTYATLALMGGVNPAYIARQMGHTNTAMLFKHYSKWIDGADAGREAGKLNTLFAHNFPTDEKISSNFNLKLVTPTGLEPVFSP